MYNKLINTFLIIILSAFVVSNSVAQTDIFEDAEGDISLGGDIFSDFNEDVEANQVLENERFYRYGRFFSLNLGLGITTFTGNRDLAYEDNHPSYQIGLAYFINFQSAFVLGLEYSKHTMLIDTYVNGYDSEIIGIVETSMLRPYMGFRYYFDTSDLGTAITYSNPYFMGRLEYWYQTNSFPERNNISDESGGGIGTGVGMGLEFPIKLKETYFGVEFLFHTVNFFDKNTNDYQKLDSEDEQRDSQTDEVLESEYGYENLNGYVYSLMLTYNISW